VIVLNQPDELGIPNRQPACEDETFTGPAVDPEDPAVLDEPDDTANDRPELHLNLLGC